MSGILGKKLKMEQLWQGEKVVPVTVVKALPNTVGLMRTKDKDGYEAIQLKHGKRSREFRIRGLSRQAVWGEAKTGDEITVHLFGIGDTVQVTGVTKGRGFAGVVKRHGFAGGPKTHGQKNRHRAPGSIGSTAFQRVVPGRRMAGHMGVDRVTVKNLKVVGIDPDNNLLMLKGAVPGARGGLLQIIRTRKAKV